MMGEIQVIAIIGWIAFVASTVMACISNESWFRTCCKMNDNWRDLLIEHDKHWQEAISTLADAVLEKEDEDNGMD